MPDDSRMVPVEPTRAMLDAARAAMKQHISSFTTAERIARWGHPRPGKGFVIPADEKHRIRYQAMLAAAPPRPESSPDGRSP